MKPFAPLAIAVLAMLVVMAPAASRECEAEGDSESEVLIRISKKPDGWEMKELIQTISEYTGKSIMYDPESPLIAGKMVEFVGTQTVPREKLFEWFQSLLSFHGIVLVEVMDGQWMALDMGASKVTDRPIYIPEAQIDTWADRTGVYLVTSVALASPADADRAMGAISSLVTPDIGRVHRVSGKPILIIGDFAPKVAAMVRAARAMEQGSERTRRETERCEELLANSRTDTAAWYFLRKLKELKAR